VCEEATMAAVIERVGPTALQRTGRFSALVVAELVVAKLKSLNLRYPQIAGEDKKEMEKARKLLVGDGEKS